MKPLKKSRFRTLKNWGFSNFSISHLISNNFFTDYGDPGPFYHPNLCFFNERIHVYVFERRSVSYGDKSCLSLSISISRQNLQLWIYYFIFSFHSYHPQHRKWVYCIATPLHFPQSSSECTFADLNEIINSLLVDTKQIEFFHPTSFHLFIMCYIAFGCIYIANMLWHFILSPIDKFSFVNIF